MLNYVRTLVSGRKQRFKDRRYDLDLSYVTPRIIAMAFPGSGVETVYRNNIDEVSKFLSERHGSNYLMINLSGKKYDTKKFNEKVLEFEWVDHHAPSLKVLFVICGKIHKFLNENEDNVIVVNCRAGKGRTGTVICCYLLFTGRFNSPDDAFVYYSKKRFNSGEGVTQPTQKMYVRYFYRMLKEKIYFPYIRSIKSITLKHVSKNSKGTLVPYFEFYLKNGEKISFSSKCSIMEQKSIAFVNDTVKITDSLFSYWFAGDITIKIYDNRMISTKKLGRISFNTAFLDKDQSEIKFHIDQIDPDNLAKNGKVPKEYQIIIKLEKMCECSNREYPVNMCKICMEFFGMTTELADWEEIRNVLSLYTPNKRNSENGRKQLKVLLFGKHYWDDVDQVINEHNSINEMKILTSYEGYDKDLYNITNSDDSSSDEDDNWKKGDNDIKEDENSSFENECIIF